MYLLLSSEQRAPVPAAIKCCIAHASGTEGALEVNGTSGSFKSNLFYGQLTGILVKTLQVGRLFASQFKRCLRYRFH